MLRRSQWARNRPAPSVLSTGVVNKSSHRGSRQEPGRDKIIVIDPLSEDCVIATGSHYLGYKASYENDENLVIIRGNQELAQAYAVHILDVYDHYRYRAWQVKNKLEGKPVFGGHIDIDDN